MNTTTFTGGVDADTIITIAQGILVTVAIVLAAGILLVTVPLENFIPGTPLMVSTVVFAILLAITIYLTSTTRHRRPTN